MLQSLTTMLFASALIAGTALIGLFIRGDWAAIRAALGFAGSVVPLPPIMRTLPVRHVAIVRVELIELRRAA